VQGPIFHNVVLIDEINRGPPRTLSALVEPMQERTATIEGTAYRLPTPHMVIATINATEIAMGSTAPLPLAILDRFTASLHVDYVDPQTERLVVKMSDALAGLDGGPASPAPPLRFDVKSVYVADDVVDYIVRLVEQIRRDERIAIPLSTRAPIALLNLARALALLDNRNYVIPDDVKKAAHPALDHRIVLKTEYEDQNPRQVVEDALSQVEPPVYL
jgi:MoxR-like ATPase